MKRRQFTLATTVATAGALWGSKALAQINIQAGKDYRVISPPAPTQAPAGKIEVVEFFRYGCPHCNAFDPMLSAWAKQLPQDVAFRRSPVEFGADSGAQQHLYYALEAMGLLDRLHSKVFAAIHVEKISLSQPNTIADWVATQGVNRERFVAQYNSFNVATKVNKATLLQNAYQLEGVPGMGIAGRFYTDGPMTQSMARVLQVIDALVIQIRAGN